MKEVRKCRVNKDTPEKYVMARLKGKRLALFEEHLLVCGECQKAVEAADLYVTSIRRALQTFTGEGIDERRLSARLQCHRKVMMTVPGEPAILAGQVTDRSENGFGLTVGVEMPRGTDVILALQGGRFHGHVAWCLPHGVAYRLGIAIRRHS
jgi:hypothetical protein